MVYQNINIVFISYVLFCSLQTVRPTLTPCSQVKRETILHNDFMEGDYPGSCAEFPDANLFTSG